MLHNSCTFRGGGMEGVFVPKCTIICIQRSHCGLLGTFSASALKSTSLLHSSSPSFRLLSHFPQGMPTGFTQTSAVHSWRGLNVVKYGHGGFFGEPFCFRARMTSPSKALAISAKMQEFEELSPSTIETLWIQIGSVCGRVVKKTEETNRQELSWFSTTVLSKTGIANFAAISTRAHRPPPRPKTTRSQVPKYVTLAIICSSIILIVWTLIRSELLARKRLIVNDQTAKPLPPPRAMVDAYERAKASIAQTAAVNRAVAAIRINNLMECTMEMELALEENRVARKSVEPDFYEEDELLQVYQGVLKIWMDGYPVDYGKVLQLRNLLDIPSDTAEALEQGIQQQSDTYAI